MRELKRAIAKLRAKGAAGPDDIPPSFLKALGDKALQTLLDIFNSSFHLAECPQIWKNAIIIPLLKSGKPPGELKSFRPISLTSCIVKLLERMLADRLIHIAETNNMLSSYQAGFRRGRSCKPSTTGFNKRRHAAQSWSYWISASPLTLYGVKNSCCQCWISAYRMHM